MNCLRILSWGPGLLTSGVCLKVGRLSWSGTWPFAPSDKERGYWHQNGSEGLCANSFLCSGGEGGTEGLRRPPSEPPSHPHSLEVVQSCPQPPEGQTEPVPVPDAGFWLALLFRHVAWLHGLGQTPYSSQKRKHRTGVARPPIPIRPTLGASPSQRRVGGACSDPGIEGHSWGGRYSPSFFGLGATSYLLLLCPAE